MRRTVKVNMINKYSKNFYMEFGITATDFCNNLRYVFAAENFGQAIQLVRRNHFLGLG